MSWKYGTGRRVNIEEGKMSTKAKTFMIIGIVVIVLILLFMLAMIINNNVITENFETTNLVINNNNITANMKYGIIQEDGIIYLSETDVSNFFDKYIYYEESINSIVTTYDDKIAEISLENDIINVNGDNKKVSAHAIEVDDEIYLPMSALIDIYNIEIEYIEETDVITMDSLDREQIRATVSSNVSVKSSTKFISRTVDKIDKGSTVIVVSTSSDGKYTKIRTENGKLGYIKTSKLENQYTVREATEETVSSEKINMTWDYYSEYVDAPDRDGTTIDGINVISPSFFYIDEDGEFCENVGDSGEDYIEWAHDNGYEIWAIVSNNTAANESLDITSEIMNSYENRKNLIENIVDMCNKYDIDGINIDFENMYEEDKDMYSRFIIELTPRLQAIGKVVSVDVTAPDGSSTWSMCFDRNVIGDVADYIIFMAYDQNGTSSKSSGTTAGYNWVETSLNKFIETEEIDSDKIILGIPFYTRIWEENSDGEVEEVATVSMKNIEDVLPDDVEWQWDEDLKQYYVEYEENGNTMKMWIENVDSLKEKVNLVNTYDLAGVASWRYGMETDDVWEMLKEALSS